MENIVNPREEKGKTIALKSDLIRVRDDYYKYIHRLQRGNMM
ncbi:MAG: hypothetical protein ACREA3_09095 [Nitrosotalea sp.]